MQYSGMKACNFWKSCNKAYNHMHMLPYACWLFYFTFDFDYVQQRGEGKGTVTHLREHASTWRRAWSAVSFSLTPMCAGIHKKTTVSLIIYILYKVSCISVKIVDLLSEWQFCKRLTMSFGLNRWVLLVVLHPLSTVILTLLQASLMCKPIISNHLSQHIHFYEFCCKNMQTEINKGSLY